MQQDQKGPLTQSLRANMAEDILIQQRVIGRTPSVKKSFKKIMSPHEYGYDRAFQTVKAHPVRMLDSVQTKDTYDIHTSAEAFDSSNALLKQLEF